MTDPSTLLLQGLQIIWINILLSGDNAVVIALASRGLEPRQRKWAILAGSLAAIVLRIIFTIFIVELQKLPYVKLGSGLLLLWIAFELLRGGEEKDVKAASSIWGAVRTIAFADAIMSLDNVVAVAAAARNSLPLIVFGIAVSVPLIIFGSTLMLKLLNRFPILVVAGAALLGWVAGEIMASEKMLQVWIGELPPHVELYAAAAGAVLILMIAAVLRWTGGPKGGDPSRRRRGADKRRRPALRSRHGKAVIIPDLRFAASGMTANKVNQTLDGQPYHGQKHQDAIVSGPMPCDFPTSRPGPSSPR